MTIHKHAGWAPPDRIRRSVVLPIWLDERISAYAVEHQSTPSAVLAQTLGQAVEGHLPASGGLMDSPVETTDERIERAVVLDSTVNAALDNRIDALRLEEHRNGAGGRGVSFSDLVAAIVDAYLEQGRNGNGAAT